MDDISHAANGSQIDVLGYRSCVNEHCGILVLQQIAERTRGLCVDCHRGALGQVLTEIEVRSRGSRLKMRGPRSTGSKPDRSKGDRWTNEASKHAAQAAKRRLVVIFPELYEILLADERARRGLDPYPIERVLDEPEGDVHGTIDFATVYHALQDHGVEVDGTEDHDAQ